MKRNRIMAALLVVVMLLTSIPGSSAKAAVPGTNRIAQTRAKKNANKVKWPQGPSKKKLSSDSDIVM